MATPRNPLDVYKSYVYHFELHAASNYEDLTYLYTNDSNLSTTSNRSNSTLLINTRRDAHQSIDNVSYTYSHPWVNALGNGAAISDLVMTIKEPGGMDFLEKLQYHAINLNIKEISSSLKFVLKIIFVGRYEDNTIESSATPITTRGGDELKPIIIPLLLGEMSADFNHQGGTYLLKFMGSFAGSVNAWGNDLSMVMGYTSKTINLKARTVREATEELQNKLNENYELLTSKIDVKGRKLRYEINLDSEINGDLDLANGDSFVQSDFKSLSFPHDTPILSAVKKILKSSIEVNKMAYDSREGLLQEFHPNVKIPVFNVTYTLNETEAVLAYNIHLYKGGIAENGEYIFDYYFSDPGKNVDVMEFDVKYNSLKVWINQSINSVSYSTNSDQTTNKDEPGHSSKTIITENMRYNRQENAGAKKALDIYLDGDVVPPPANPLQEDQGWITHTHEGAIYAKLAFESVNQASQAVTYHQSFKIRGHYNLLINAVPVASGANGSGVLGFGMVDGLWMKVNIRNRRGQLFFYTGWYRIDTVENHFSNGLFTQHVVAAMMDRNINRETLPSQPFNDRRSSSAEENSSTVDNVVDTGPVTDQNGFVIHN